MGKNKFVLEIVNLKTELNKLKNNYTRRVKIDQKIVVLSFFCRVIEIVEVLPSTRTGNSIAGQLIRCGLAPALLYEEAQSAESRADFIHKMKIFKTTKNKSLLKNYF